jgi:hypothetical protein
MIANPMTSLCRRINVSSSIRQRDAAIGSYDRRST